MHEQQNNCMPDLGGMSSGKISCVRHCHLGLSLEIQLRYYPMHARECCILELIDFLKACVSNVMLQL